VVSEDKDAEYVTYLKDESKEKLKKWMHDHQTPPLVIATGFIASTSTGRPTTLRR
jgi:capsule polysaccharide export protein KpsC/LpsZ